MAANTKILPTISESNRVQVPGAGLLNNIFVKAGDFNKVVSRLNSITTSDSSLTIALHITDTTQSTSSTTGSLIVDGGVGIAKDVYIAGVINGAVGVNLATASGVTTVGSTTAATISAAGLVTVANATDSTSGTTGAINSLGGLGVTKKIFAGTSVTTPAVVADSITEKTASSGIKVGSAANYRNTLTALNSTGTLSAAILATGGMTSTSGAAVVATIDTIANIATQFGAITTGMTIPFLVQNVGSNTVTLALPAGMVAAKQVSNGDTAVDINLVVTNSATVGSSKFEIVFISATAAVLHRIF